MARYICKSKDVHHMLKLVVDVEDRAGHSDRCLTLFKTPCSLIVSTRAASVTNYKGIHTKVI